jgi:hypothetical protein
MQAPRLFLATVMSLRAACLPAGADDSDLAARTAAELKQLLPGYDITETDPLTLKLHKSGAQGSQDMQINLDRIRQFCLENPDRCDGELADFATKVAAVVKEGEAQANPTPSMLRVIVRTVGYANELNNEISPQSNRVVDAPIAANLVAMCAFDTANAVRPVLASDLKALGLTDAAAMAACRANSAIELPPPLSQMTPLEPHMLGVLKVGYYTSSEFAFPERWAAVNQKLGGKLIVCVPGNDVVLYARGDNADDVDALRQYAVQAARTSDRPISTDVYRWTKTGWEIVP